MTTCITRQTQEHSDLAPDTPVRKRVLMISYAFPPVGGAGVQRVTKFVKYLGEYGWDSSVLTVANPSVPVLDESLVKDIPPETIIRRARTWEPSYALKTAVASTDQSHRTRSGGWRGMVSKVIRELSRVVLQPDPQILWLPNAIREGRRLLREVPHAAILASGPPFSSFLVGASLARRTGLPLILDYRDEWTLSSAYAEHRSRDSISRFIQARMQKKVMRVAQAILATTRSSAEALDVLRKQAKSDAIVDWIYNGYDPDDFTPSEALPSTSETYRLTYVGTIWNLTSIEPLVKAVTLLVQQRPTLVRNLELVFAGRRVGEQQKLIESLRALPCRVVEHPYLEHRKVLTLYSQTDGLCLLLSDVPGAERVVPAKLFEYLASKRPILGITPRGETWNLLSESSTASLHLPRDIEGIAQHLARCIQQKGSAGVQDGESVDVSRFDRRNQTGDLASLLDRLVAVRP